MKKVQFRKAVPYVSKINVFSYIFSNERRAMKKFQKNVEAVIVQDLAVTAHTHYNVYYLSFII